MPSLAAAEVPETKTRMKVCKEKSVNVEVSRKIERECFCDIRAENTGYVCSLPAGEQAVAGESCLPWS